MSGPEGLKIQFFELFVSCGVKLELIAISHNACCLLYIDLALKMLQWRVVTVVK